jgi:hypothetical protein
MKYLSLTISPSSVGSVMTVLLVLLDHRNILLRRTIYILALLKSILPESFTPRSLFFRGVSYFCLVFIGIFK